MKRFFMLGSAFVLIAVAMDACFGAMMDFIMETTDETFVGEINYLSKDSEDDLVVFGSSRAANHYVTPIFADSLNVMCYNCGQPACGVYMAYAKLAMLLTHHKPMHIIYDVTPRFDYLDGGDNQTLFQLKPYYSLPEVDSVLSLLDPYMCIKMRSGFYRYNTVFLQNLMAYSKHQKSDNLKLRGWRPLEGGPDTLKFDNSIEALYPHKDGYRYDANKLQYLRRFAERTRYADVTFVVSPIWYGMDTAVLDTVKKICREYDIRLLDYSNDSRYVHNMAVFRNGKHLNSEGAKQFTREIIQRLREEGVFDDVAEVDDDEASAK